MAYTKSAVKLQNFPDIAISFWGKFTYKPLFSLIFFAFSILNQILFYLTRYSATKSLSIDSGIFEAPNS